MFGLTNKKVTINDLLQLWRSFEALSLDHCTLCMGNGELIDHLCLLYPVILELWHKLLRLARLDWVPPRSISDMMTISSLGFGEYYQRQSSMANCLSYADLDSMIGKEIQGSLGTSGRLQRWQLLRAFLSMLFKFFFTFFFPLDFVNLGKISHPSLVLLILLMKCLFPIK